MEQRVIEALGMYRYIKALITDLEATKVGLRNNDNPLLLDGIVEIGVATVDGIIAKLHQDLAHLEVGMPDLILLYNEE